MQPTETLSMWLFVAHTTLHLDTVKAGEESWWCVDRRCKPGEKAFIYRPLKGIILYFEILEFMKTPNAFCNSFQMGTAEIRMLNVFDPPIPSKEVKASAARNEGFIRRNFQGKSFVLTSNKTAPAILALARKAKPEAKSDRTKSAPAKLPGARSRRVS